MRISDWSSDVCSSDLHRLARRAGRAGLYLRPAHHHPRRRRYRRHDRRPSQGAAMMGAGKAWLVAAVALALLLIVLTFPMRLALAWADADDAGIAAREVRGSIWSGELVEARLGPLPLGPVKATLSPLAPPGGPAHLGLLRPHPPPRPHPTPPPPPTP